MGFSLSLSLLPAILATGLLAFTLVGLPLSFPPNAPAFAGRTTVRESFHLTRLLDDMALVMRTSGHVPFFGRGSDDGEAVDSSEPRFRPVLLGARDPLPTDRLNESTVHILHTARAVSSGAWPRCLA